MDKIVKSYNIFLNEGQREQKKIDELLDILSRRKLTEDEKELLTSLSKGGSLPPEEKKSTGLSTTKSGSGYLFDDEGRVLTNDEEKPGQEFVTAKGKQSGVNKIEAANIIDARVYRNRDNEERFIYSSITIEGENGMTSDWIIYRTGGGPQFPFGQFLDTNAPKFRYYKSTPPDVLWSELDYKFDYGMILDEDLYEDFTNFVELYKENMARNKEFLTRIYKRLCEIL
jgi:hypothetical protein